MRQLSIYFKLQNKPSQRYISLTKWFNKDNTENNKSETIKAENEVKEKPVLDVISSAVNQETLIYEEKAKEKNLEPQEIKRQENTSEQSRQIISSESIKKLKDKIIGKAEKEEDPKGKK